MDDGSCVTFSSPQRENSPLSQRDPESLGKYPPFPQEQDDRNGGKSYSPVIETLLVPPLMKSNFSLQTKVIPDRALASLQYSLSFPSEDFPGLAALPSSLDLRATSKFPFRKPLP